MSPLLGEAIAVALRAARLTDGDVDPTVADAMSALGYDRDFALLPDTGPPVRLTVRAVPGWRQVGFDERSRLLTLPRGVHLDLGATAKAWAADRSAARLAGALGCGVLVGLGGDIAVAGPPPGGGWRIRVQDVTGRPEDPPEGPAAVVAIAEGGLATSSTTARRWRRGGDVLHHILDPRTGLPAPVHWRTVSVAAATCVDANTASTAAIIRGPQALDWLSNLRLPARLVDAAGTVRTVGGWPAEAGGSENDQRSRAAGSLSTEDLHEPPPVRRARRRVRAAAEPGPPAGGHRHGRHRGRRHGGRGGRHPARLDPRVGEFPGRGQAGARHHPIPGQHGGERSIGRQRGRDRRQGTQASSPPRAEAQGGRPGYHRARRAGTHACRDGRAAADHVRWLLTGPAPVPPAAAPGAWRGPGRIRPAAAQPPGSGPACPPAPRAGGRRPARES